MKIQAENLGKSYFLDHGVETMALRGVNFSVESGETVAIVGPSGAGKSTLLHLVGLMDSPTAGRILLDGRDYTRATEQDRTLMRRNSIGFLFQMHYLLPDFTVWENVLIPVWADRGRRESDARSILERLGLASRLAHRPGELSGGEQQRVALARALAGEPRLLLADEPTGNLDRKTGDGVESLLFSESKKRNITLVVVTHNADLARKADRIVTMQDGVIIRHESAVAAVS